MTPDSQTVPAAQRPASLAGSDGFVAAASEIGALPGPPGLPLLGNLHQLKVGSFHLLLERWARLYGPIYRFRLRGKPVLGISEPGLIHELLRQRPGLVRRSPRLSAVIDETGFRGLFTAEGEPWKRQRRLVMRALTPEAVRHFFPIIHRVTQRLLHRWTAAAAPLDVTRDLKCYSIDVMTWLAMGVDVNTLENARSSLQEDVEYWFATIGRRLPALFPYWRYVKLPEDRRTDVVLARLMETVQVLIADARVRLRTQAGRNEQPSNILEALVAARDEAGSEFTDEDVVGNVATMLFAGEDTTATTLAWMLHFLAVTPQAARTIADEVDEVLAGAAMPDAYECLEQFKHIEAAAMESMRLKPIAPVQSMCMNADAELAGLRVPAGTLLFLLPRVAGTDGGRFAQPQCFQPERFLRQDERSEARATLMPFGVGPRFCPGRYLAMVKMRMVVSMTMRNFVVRLEQDPSTVREYLTVTLGPQALSLRLSRRFAQEAGA